MSSNLLLDAGFCSIRDGVGSRLLTSAELLSIAGYLSSSGISVFEENVGLEANFGQDLYIESIRLCADKLNNGEVLFQTYSNLDSIWRSFTPIYSGNSYIHTFFQNWPHAAQPAKYIRVFYRSFSSNPVTLSGLIVFGKQNYIGVDYSHLPIPAINEYEASRLIITNNDIAGRSLDINAVIGFSGDYIADSRFLISDSMDSNWVSLDSGHHFSTLESWRRGSFFNTQVSGNNLVLEEDQLNGYWISPVIDTGNSNLRSVYVYGNGFNEESGCVYKILEVRASDQAPYPRFVISMADATRNSEWCNECKRLYLDPTGEEIASYYAGGQSDYDFKLARYTVDGSNDLGFKYYSGYNNLGMVATLVPSRTPWDMDCPTDDWEDYFCFCKTWEDMSVDWSNGFHISVWPDLLSLDSPSNWSVIASQVIPDNLHFDSWVAICLVAKTSLPSRVHVLLAEIFSDQITAWNMEEFDNFSNITMDTFALCAALDREKSFWVFLGEPYMKVYRYSGIELKQSFNLSRSYRFLVPLPSGQSGFWGITSSSVHLHFEVDGSLIEVLSVSEAEGISFGDIISASADMENNLWFYDYDSKRIIHVSYEKSMVDFVSREKHLQQLWTHPIDGSVYFYCNADLEYPFSDTIRRFVLDDKFSTFVCPVPGHKVRSCKSLAFEGIISSSCSKVSMTDPIWGHTDGSLSWSLYPNGSLGMDKGRYKQVRLHLMRKDLSDALPTISGVYFPQPVILKNVAPRQSSTLFIKPNKRGQIYRGKFLSHLKIYWDL